MIQLELDQIMAYLGSKDITAEIQKETKQICILLKIGEREFPLFIRIFDGDELVQFLAFLPCSIAPQKQADLARLLHLLNKELDIPGFGMDETSSVIFYRCMVPVKDKQIDAQIFEAYLNAVQIVCKSFAAVIVAVAQGTVTFDEVVKKSQEHQGKSVSERQIEKE